MNNAPWYPIVEHGTEILWASNPHAGEAGWQLGTVAITKTNSCDIVLADGSLRANCIHVDDPRCRETRDWAAIGRGVFKLAPKEVRNREIYEVRIPRLELRVRDLEQTLEDFMFSIHKEIKSLAGPTKGTKASKSQPLKVT